MLINFRICKTVSRPNVPKFGDKFLIIKIPDFIIYKNFNRSVRVFRNSLALLLHICDLSVGQGNLIRTFLMAFILNFSGQQLHRFARGQDSRTLDLDHVRKTVRWVKLQVSQQKDQVVKCQEHGHYRKIVQASKVIISIFNQVMVPGKLSTVTSKARGAIKIEADCPENCPFIKTLLRVKV